MLWFYFFATCVLSILLTPAVIFAMRRFAIIDSPKTEKRKIHKKNIPLGGGVVIYCSFVLMLAASVWLFHDVGSDIHIKSLIGICLGGLFLIIGGLIDDKYILRPRYQILFPVLASITAIVFGIGIESITNPSGGVIQLNAWTISIEGLGNLLVFADTIVFFWLMGMMITTKFLDGLDGLVAGISAIGAFMVFFVSREPQWYQPEVARVAILFAGACVGFLVWNFHPAKIFLGEGGSLFTGYILGILALISGSKVATTLLVMGFPILDVLRVIMMRMKKGKPIFVGDQEHIHFRLLQSGFSQRQAVLLLYSISVLFGLSTLFLQNHQKFIALSFLFVLMMLLALFFIKKDQQQERL